MKSSQAVIITGGAKRVGAALSRSFARRGFDILLHYHRSASDALLLKAEIEALGRACILLPQDLSDIQALPALIKKAHEAMPHCAALINNASVFEQAVFTETDEALLDHQFAANFKAPFFLTQAFAATFGKGCVINMLDTHITQTHGTHFAYLLSKKTLAEFTLMAARALGPAVRVNGVCPGILLPSNELDKSYMEELSPTLPLQKLGALQDVAEAAHWLCSAEGITGQLIFTDGGQHLL
jgi:NAD(P)-dependent dehydrogenase (short-subunit alcohol dehydrogenase family)